MDEIKWLYLLLVTAIIAVVDSQDLRNGRQLAQRTPSLQRDSKFRLKPDPDVEFLNQLIREAALLRGSEFQVESNSIDEFPSGLRSAPLQRRGFSIERPRRQQSKYGGGRPPAPPPYRPDPYPPQPPPAYKPQPKPSYPPPQPSYPPPKPDYPPPPPPTYLPSPPTYSPPNVGYQSDGHAKPTARHHYCPLTGQLHNHDPSYVCPVMKMMHIKPEYPVHKPAKQHYPPPPPPPTYHPTVVTNPYVHRVRLAKRSVSLDIPARTKRQAGYGGPIVLPSPSAPHKCPIAPQYNNDNKPISQFPQPPPSTDSGYQTGPTTGTGTPLSFPSIVNSSPAQISIGYKLPEQTGKHSGCPPFCRQPHGAMGSAQLAMCAGCPAGPRDTYPAQPAPAPAPAPAPSYSAATNEKPPGPPPSKPNDPYLPQPPPGTKTGYSQSSNSAALYTTLGSSINKGGIDPYLPQPPPGVPATISYNKTPASIGNSYSGDGSSIGSDKSYSNANIPSGNDAYPAQPPPGIIGHGGKQPSGYEAKDPFSPQPPPGTPGRNSYNGNGFIGDASDSYGSKPSILPGPANSNQYLSPGKPTAPTDYPPQPPPGFIAPVPDYLKSGPAHRGGSNNGQKPGYSNFVGSTGATYSSVNQTKFPAYLFTPNPFTIVTTNSPDAVYLTSSAPPYTIPPRLYTPEPATSKPSYGSFVPFDPKPSPGDNGYKEPNRNPSSGSQAKPYGPPYDKINTSKFVGYARVW